MQEYDIAIIGGGPVGMFAAFYAGLRDTKAVLIESMATLGGQVSALYPEKHIFDVAGFPNIKGRDLVEQLTQQMAKFPIEVLTHTTVSDVVKQDERFIITTNQSMIVAKSIIVATGKGAFEPRKMQIEGVEPLVGHGVHYFVPDPEQFRNHDIAIAGGGDSAVDMAVMLNEVANQTTIIHRREQFRAMEQSVKALNASDIDQATPRRVVQVIPTVSQKLEITLAHVKNPDDIQTIVVDDLTINYGFISENKTVLGWQAQPESVMQGMIVNQEMATNIPGYFVIGDANYYDGKNDLIAIGFGEAPAAINAAIRFFDPHRGGPGHSSAMSL